MHTIYISVLLMKNEKSCIASYYRQVSTNIKNRNKKLKPVLIAQAFGLFGLLKLVPFYTLHCYYFRLHICCQKCKEKTTIIHWIHYDDKRRECFCWNDEAFPVFITSPFNNSHVFKSKTSFQAKFSFFNKFK